MKLEYKIFNMSEATSTLTWLDVLNLHGKSGWKVIERINKTSFLMMRVMA